MKGGKLLLARVHALGFGRHYDLEQFLADLLSQEELIYKRKSCGDEGRYELI